MKRFAIIIAILVTILLQVIGCSATERKTESGSDGTETGGASLPVAPDFTMKTISGETVSLSDFKGKPIVLNFAASWCGPCEYEAPILAQAYEKYKNEVTFLGAAVKDDLESQRAFAAKHGLKFPIGMDPSGDILYSYQVAGKVSLPGIPTTFFIDRNGNIATFWVGPVSESTFERLVQTIR